MTASSRFASLTRLAVNLTSSDRRVIALPFTPGRPGDTATLFDLVASLSDADAERELASIRSGFAGRHEDLVSEFEEHYLEARRALGEPQEVAGVRRLLLGAYFTMEYSLQSAALFNPSMVPHPDQHGVPPDGVRFVMSLRATGEGHVSSVVFEEGVINGAGHVMFERSRRPYRRPVLSPDAHYHNDLFRCKLREMESLTPAAEAVMALLPESFTLPQLETAIATTAQAGRLGGSDETGDHMLWLARSNYQLDLTADACISDIVIFPQSDNESRGIEDVRLVRFAGDPTPVYYGTYTAFNGHRSLPMLMETVDFRTIKIHSLNGPNVRNKGFALFPRRVKGRYAMCSRIDGRNLYMMYSDAVYFWESAELLATPKYPWEYRLIGNCGSPLETDAGWLLLTHGVGPMRQYAIGAMLLDLDAPVHVRGRLREPLLLPTAEERDGYVPNVVYSCGSLIHRGKLYLPYAAADKTTAMVSLEVDELVQRLLADGP